MYVKKFEADSMEEALQNVKEDLGPDAIVLKTISNKGLKGAFKNKRIEITAAISERNYAEKLKVDSALGDGLKDQFYKAPSTNLSLAIKEYNNSNELSQKYGPASADKILPRPQANESSGLDEFLKENTSSDELHGLKEKVDELQAQIKDLQEQWATREDSAPVALREVRNQLRSLGVSEEFIHPLVKDFSQKTDDYEQMIDQILAKMMAQILTKKPLLAQSPQKDSPITTIFLSDHTCGQTSLVYKASSMAPNSQVIHYPAHSSSPGKTFIENFIGVEGREVSSFSELVKLCRQNTLEGVSTLVDYRGERDEPEDLKRRLEGLKRGMDRREVFTCLSAINASCYNERALVKYRDVCDGIVVNFIDQCLDYGMLYNMSQKFQELPFVLFGHGSVVPDDIELATAERVLAGMFKLK